MVNVSLDEVSADVPAPLIELSLLVVDGVLLDPELAPELVLEVEALLLEAPPVVPPPVALAPPAVVPPPVAFAPPLVEAPRANDPSVVPLVPVSSGICTIVSGALTPGNPSGFARCGDTRGVGRRAGG